MLAKFQQGGILVSRKGVDLYLGEAMDDTGAEPYKGAWWGSSPDIWVRNQPDGKTGDQKPIYGKDNWVYVRVHNRGSETAKAYVVTFNAKKYLGSQFKFPGDWVPPMGAGVRFNLAPGKTQDVPMKWPAELVPQPVGTDYTCLLCQVQALVPTEQTPTPIGIEVWQSNNLAQRNLSALDMKASMVAHVPVQLGSLFTEHPEVYRLEVMRPEKWANLPMELQATVPADAKPGEMIELHIVQRNRANQIVGGVAVQINVTAK